MNAPTIITASIIAMLFIAIVVNAIRNKKKGKSPCACSGGCSGCSGCCDRK